MAPFNRLFCAVIGPELGAINSFDTFHLQGFDIITDFSLEHQTTSAGSLQFPYHPESIQEIRFFGKIGFLKPCPRYSRNPIFWKNRISQTVCPKYQKNPIFWKNRISQTVPKVPKKSDFFGKIGFLLKWSGLEISAFVY
jgi:hypothetical protein